MQIKKPSPFICFGGSGITLLSSRTWRYFRCEKKGEKKKYNISSMIKKKKMINVSRCDKR